MATAVICGVVTETASAATSTSSGKAGKHDPSGGAGVTHPAGAPLPPPVTKLKPVAAKKQQGPGAVTAAPTTPGANTDPAAALHAAQGTALVQAKATDKPVAIPEMTTASSRATANPDGTISVATTLSPVRAKVGNDWVPIDTTLALGTDSLWHPRAAPVGITFSNGGSVPLAVVDQGGKKITVTWPLGPLPSPHAADNNLTYPAILPGIDLRVSADPQGIREVLIVHDAAAAANPALTRLHFGVTGTGVAISSADGGLTGKDSTGKTVFTSPAPQMWDATDTPDPTTAQSANKATSKDANQASYTLSHHDVADSPGHGGHSAQVPLTVSDGQAHLAVDQSLFKAPGLTWPMYIDPSITVSQLHYAQIHSDGGANNPALAPHTWYDIPPDGAGDQIMRVGWDGGSNELGDWRSMFSFDVYGTLENAPGDTAGNLGAYIGDGVYEDGSNLTNVSLSLWSSGGTTTNPNIDVDAINRFPGYAPNWNSDGGSNGMWKNPTTLFSGYHMSGAGAGNQMFIGAAPNTPLFNVVKNAYSNGFTTSGDGTVTFGLKANNEAAGVTPYWGFFFGDHACGCYPNDNATLTITFTPLPYIIDNTLSGAPNSGCGTTDQDSLLQQNAGYVRKNIGNQVTLGGHVGDIDSGRTLNVTYDFRPYVGGQPSGNVVAINAGQLSPTLGMAHQNPNDTHSPYIPNPQQLPGATLTQTGAGLVDGTLYRFEAHAVDNGNSSLSSDTTLAARQECYFIPAFTNPNPPSVTSTVFPQLGNQPSPGMYASVASPAGTGFSVTGSTSGVAIDHYDYLINGDSSQVPYNPPGCTTSTAGCMPASSDSQYSALVPVPAGATTFGTNTLWIRAVDKAGNTSAFYNYSFYLPGKPLAKPVLGNVTGNGVPDVVAIAPDGHGNSHLVVFPGNEDPNVLGTVDNAVEAAPASAAPDGKTWDNTVVTHRGADRGIPVDDLFAFSETTKSLYYYLNSAVFGGTVPNDMFSQTHQILVTRPTCSPTAANDNCFGYAADWSNVTAILALGNAAGGKIGTFAGRTNLITVESDGNHGAKVWMFSPAGAGQLVSPILLSNGSYPFNWADADLIAPGATTASGLPDLWVRDRATGTLYQFTNTKNAQNVEDPTSLGSTADMSVVGGKGEFNATAYPTLVSAGNPAIASGTGVLSQTSPPALWGVQPDGQLKLFPGSSNGPIVSAGSGQGNAWSTSSSGWVNSTGTTSVNGAAVAVSTGPIRVGVDQFTGNDLCIDLQTGNTAPNTPVWIFTCNGTGPQVWTIMTDGTIRYGGPSSTACLQVSNTPAGAQYGLPSTQGNVDGTMAGAPVVIGACPTTGQAPNGLQRWVFRPSAVASANFAAQNLSTDDWYNIYNPNSGRYLDNPGNSTTSQTQLQIWDLTDTQSWLNANNPNYRTQEFEVPAAVGTWLQAQATGLATQTKETSSPAATNQTGQPTPDGTAYVLPATAVNNHFGVDWYIPYPGDYTIAPTMTVGPGNGQVQLTVAQGTGAGAGNPVTLPMTPDTYAPTAGENIADFGTVHIPSAGMYAFTFTVYGKNPSSTGYTLALDTLSAGPDHGTGPNARLAPSTGVINTPASADASGSFPGAAAIVSYKFDFGDGTAPVTGTAASVAHTYTKLGIYTATVTVTDHNNISASTTGQITVLSGPVAANGDFETGSLAGWPAAYNSTITTDNPHSGTFAGQINAPTGGNGAIEQVINGLSPNTSYTLTGWIRTDGGATILGTKQYDAADDDTGATTSATTWTQLSSQFTTGPSNTSVDVYCYRSMAGTSACDDFTLVATPAAGAVANPDFETGNLAGWNASYNSGVTTSNTHGGDYAGQINVPTGGNGSIEQIVGGLAPNTSYTLTGWVRTDGGATILGTKDFDADPNDDTGNTTTATAWTQLTSQFTTGPTNTTVDIYCYRSTAGSSACDDFNLTKN